MPAVYTLVVVADPTTKVTSVSGTDSLGILRDIGRSLRRVKGKDDFGRDGLRVVWHQGKLRTDLSSWENASQEIHRQEFSFFGHMVEFRRGPGIRTGVLPNNEGEGVQALTPKSELFKPHRDADTGILEAASTILRAVPRRDYFTQHLLKEVNDALNAAQQNMRRTQVLGLDLFHALEHARREEATKAPPRVSNTTYLAAAIVGAAVIVAATLFVFLWRH